MQIRLGSICPSVNSIPELWKQLFLSSNLRIRPNLVPGPPLIATMARLVIVQWVRDCEFLFYPLFYFSHARNLPFNFSHFNSPVFRLIFLDTMVPRWITWKFTDDPAHDLRAKLWSEAVFWSPIYIASFFSKWEVYYFRERYIKMINKTWNISWPFPEQHTTLQKEGKKASTLINDHQSED